MAGEYRKVKVSSISLFLIGRIITSLADIVCLIKSLALNVSGSTGSAQKIILVEIIKYTQRRKCCDHHKLCCEQISSNADLLPSTIDVCLNCLKYKHLFSQLTVNVLYLYFI